MNVQASLGPFRRPRFRRLLSAQLAADLGDGMVTVALPLYVYELTGSASKTSLAFVAEIVAGLVLALIGGVLADRRDRHRNLVISYALRATLLASIAVMPVIALALVCGIGARALGMADNPSFEALVPGLAEGDLQQVVAARRVTQAASILVGPAIGGALVSVIGAHSTLAWASLLFVLGLIALMTLSGLDTTLEQRRATLVGESRSAALASMLDGLRILRDTPFARRLLIYWAVSMASTAVAMLAALVWFKRDLSVPDVWYGVSIAAYGVGALLGLFWAGGRAFRLPLAAILRRAIPVYAAFTVVAVAWHAPWLMLVSWFGWGVAMGPEIVVGETALVSLIPEGARGRVSAGQAIIVQIGLAVGYGIGGPLVDRAGARAATVISGLVTLSLIRFWTAPPRSRLRATRGAPDDQVASRSRWSEAEFMQ